MFGCDAYPALHALAAALLHALASNGHRPHASHDDVVHLVVSIADGTLAGIDKIVERLAAWSTTGVSGTASATPKPPHSAEQ